MNPIKSLLLPVHAIALNSFREAVRNKVLGSLLGFAALLSGASLLLAEMSLHHEARVTLDASLFFCTLFGALIAVYSSVTLLQTEIERRTLYTILSKPISRWQFILGKFLGIAGLLAVVTTLMAFLALGLATLQGAETGATFAAAYFTVYLRLCIVAAITIFFATFSSPLLSGLFATSIFVAGHLVSQLEAMKNMMNEGPTAAFSPIVDFVALTLPDLEALNLSQELTYGVTIPEGYAFASAWYACSYSAMVLLCAMYMFSRRDFQ